MKNLKNEKGYALVIVLLTITIMFPLGAMLLFANTNSARQLQNTEEYNASVAMAEMGIVFANAKIEQILNEALPAVIDEYRTSVNPEEQIYRSLAEAIEESFPVTENYEHQIGRASCRERV